MNDLILQLQQTVFLLQKNIPSLLLLIAALWLLQLLNWLVGYRLNLLGIYPRSWHGFIGIAFSPFLHGDFNHLFFNSLPLFVLACFVLLQGWAVFFTVSLIIILLSGFAVWLLGRPALHVGASSLIMGYWSYLMINAYHQPTLVTVMLGIVCFYYIGAALILNLFPRQQTSWEGHIFGFAAGIAAAYLYPYFL